MSFGGGPITRELDYSTIKPPGIPSKITTQKYMPSTGTQLINPGDIVRFELNSNGFWDPYHAFFNIDVSFITGEDNVIYQLDGSAHSFIRYMVIFNRGTEIERIMEYDILAQMLIDINYPIHKRFARQMEGMGYANYSDITFGKIEGGLTVVKTSNLLLPNIKSKLATDADQGKIYIGRGVANTVTAPQYGIHAADITHIGNAPHIIDTTETEQATYGLFFSMVKFSERYHNLGSHLTKFSSVGTPTLQDYVDAAIVLNPSSDAGLITSTLKFDRVGTVNTIGGDTRLECVEDVTGNDWTFEPSSNVGIALFRQNGQNGVDPLFDLDVADGSTEKNIFNYALSNAGFEP